MSQKRIKTCRLLRAKLSRIGRLLQHRFGSVVQVLLAFQDKSLNNKKIPDPTQDGWQQLGLDITGSIPSRSFWNCNLSGSEGMSLAPCWKRMFREG